MPGPGEGVNERLVKRYWQRGMDTSKGRGSVSLKRGQCICLVWIQREREYQTEIALYSWMVYHLLSEFPRGPNMPAELSGEYIVC